jgi:alkylation response protein AidB-like acyl-CoA dehydrogenase
MSALASGTWRDESVSAELAAWLELHADALDTDPARAADLLPQLTQAGLARIGVPHAWGGSGGTIADAIAAIATLARHSLTAAFVLWGHRTFIEYLVQSDNEALRERWLPALLAGDIAGATGLSNAMKYLSRIESLQMRASRSEPGWSLSGNLPWITNLRPQGFVVAAAFEHLDGAPPSIFAIPHDAPGVARGADLDLVAMRASHTAALTLNGTVLDAASRIAGDARAFLLRVRPAFLGLQCGMSVGLAQRSLAEVAAASVGARAAIQAEAADVEARLGQQTKQLLGGVLDGTFGDEPAALFELRISLAKTVEDAVALEVQASGGCGYLHGTGGTARRVREAAFVPIVTPSLVQLKAQLADYYRMAAR